MSLTLKEEITIRESLDALALALAGHHHTWTPEERRLYVQSLRILTKTRKLEVSQ